MEKSKMEKCEESVLRYVWEMWNLANDANVRLDS